MTAALLRNGEEPKMTPIASIRGIITQGACALLAIASAVLAWTLWLDAIYDLHLLF